MDLAAKWLDSGWQGEVPAMPSVSSWMGVHLLADLYGCSQMAMGDANSVQEIYRQAAQIGNCNVVSEHYHQFEPWGVSGVTVLSESHISHHGWDEEKYVAIDFFYCCDDVQPIPALEFLAKAFGAKEMQVRIGGRGCRTRLSGFNRGM